MTAPVTTIDVFAPRNDQPKLYPELDSGNALMAQGEAAFYNLIAEQLEPAFGHELPQMEIRCKNLSVVADVSVIERKSRTSHAELPSIYNSIKHMLQKLTASRHVTKRLVLDRVDAVFEPGTITLLLGQPGSGKTSLMKVLSGQFPIENNITLEGDVLYNGRAMNELLPKLPQLVAYVPQTDEHFPALSVEETLEFAHACCKEEVVAERGQSLLSHGTPEQNEAALCVAESLFKNYPDVIVQQLGLQSCRDTVIGNALKCGVSGGERRRGSIGEMEFGMKYAMFMDEISTGLDSAATFDIVSTQRDIAKKLHKTVVMALLQPTPEVFGLFDNVLLLNDGQVMYHGPRDNVLPYFESLGFVCPPDRDVADYLLDLGTDEQYQYETSKKSSNHASFLIQAPRFPSEFADRFRQSILHQDIDQALDAPWSRERVRDAKQHFDTMSEFRQSFWSGTLTLMRRQMVLAVRNTAFMRARALMIVIMGYIYGSTFASFDPTNAQVTLGVLFQTTVFLAMGQASQTPVFIAARDIYYKHRRANFYRTSSFAIACLAALVPLAIVECLVFSCFAYIMCSFVGEVSNFLFFLLCMVLTNLALCAWFFALTAMAPSFHIAKPCSILSMAIYVVFAGFIVPHSRIPDCLAWLYWINPLAWSLRAVAVNQYRSPELDVCEYAGGDYCAKYNMTMGEYSLSLYDIPSGKGWQWAGVFFLLFTIAFFAAVGSCVLEYKRYDVPAETNVLVWSSDDDEKSSKLDDTSEEQEQSDDQDETTNYVMVTTPRADSNSQSYRDSQADTVTIDMNREHDGFVPVTLAFVDLWYSVPSPRHKHESIDLLKGVTGYALPGTMTALMGSSGAGKTTLMDVVAGRKTGGTIRGDVLLNGYPATQLAIRRCTGYCEQQDIHSEGATIREALTFSAFLRQDSRVSEQAKLASVEECLDLLDLRAIADKIIRGRSQEQMKHLTIGVELAAQPSVLFLDEPTSGLDAHSAKAIMNGVRKVASNSRTVVCTIHQPSSDVFFLFDSLLLLKCGGEMVFFGDLDNVQPDERMCGHLVDYFEAIPEVSPLPLGQNLATWMLECIGAGVAGAGEKVITDAAADVDFVQHFRDSMEHQVLLAHLAESSVTTPAPDSLPELVFQHKRAATPWMQLRMIMQQFQSIYWRTPSYNLTRCWLALILAIIFGLVLINVDYTTYQGLNSAVGIIFMTTLYQGYVMYVACLPFTLRERAVYYRERDAQTYNTLWYFLGITFVEIPYVFGSSLLFTIVFFPLLGIWSFSTAVLYWLNISLSVLMQTFLGQLLVYLLSSGEVVAVVGVLINAIFLLFAGFNPPATAIPDRYRWLYDVTPQRYSLSILVSLVFGNCPEGPVYDGVTKGYTNVRSELACQPYGMHRRQWVTRRSSTTLTTPSTSNTATCGPTFATSWSSSRSFGYWRYWRCAT
uniref:ABC transporter domain-containing protein n=1 Tax=Hyaloperonospora arabidopsidis (strain Emoy2) TaxID=559515 RepID=M4BPN9_HYAAE